MDNIILQNETKKIEASMHLVSRSSFPVSVKEAETDSNLLNLPVILSALKEFAAKSRLPIIYDSRIK